MFTLTDLMTDVSDALKSAGVFSTVIIREDSSAVIGREPAAYIEYGGMTALSDSGAYIEEHRINVSVRLLSIGSADLSPLRAASEALRNIGAHSLKSELASTDSRTVTFRLEAVFRG